MMRAPPVAPPLPRPPPPPPMALPPPSQGPAPQLAPQPIQHMAAAPQVAVQTSWPDQSELLCCGWIACECVPAGLRNGLHGVRPVYSTGAPPSHQTNTIHHSGCTHGLLCPHGIQTHRLQDFETNSIGVCVCVCFDWELVFPVGRSEVTLHCGVWVVLCLFGPLPLLLPDLVFVRGCFRKS